MTARTYQRSTYQRSFAGGEITPEMYGRLDLRPYQTGAARVRNFRILPHGPAENRAGFAFVNKVKDSTKKTVLLPFIYSSDQSIVLEFGDQYIRFHTLGGTVLEASQNITAITNANPGVVTYSGADNYANGDWVYISGVGGMTELNGRYFRVGGLNAGANTFELRNPDNTNVSTSAYGTYTSGGTIAEVYTISSPYLEADLYDLHLTQSADVLTITHPLYQQRELRRSGATSWALTTLSFTPTQAAPTSPEVNRGSGTGTKQYMYKITSVAEDGLEESLPTSQYDGAARTITGITNANPGVLTFGAAHALAIGDVVYITGVGGMTELNDQFFSVNTAPSGTQITLADENGTVVNTTTYGVYTSGGTLRKMVGVTNDLATTGNWNKVLWTDATGAIRYNIYKRASGVYGYIGQATAGATGFKDDNITPDLSQTPPEGTDPFDGAGDYPGAVGYHRGRRWFAGTTNKPQNLWGTRSGTESNLTFSIPTRDDDSISVRLTSRQANTIRHIVPLNDMLLLTSGAEWLVTTANSDILSPTSIDYKVQGYIGASNVQPVVTSHSVVYAQARGGRIREMKYTWESQRYSTNDISIMAPHLFTSFTIKQMAFQAGPYPTIWCVRSDGVLLGLTYLPEQEVMAWHQHDTSGEFESVCVVPEDDDDVVYVVVKRTLDGETVRTIERMDDRQFTRLQDAFFVDCGASFANTVSATLTPGTGADVAGTEDVVFTAGSSTFVADDVGSFIHYDYDALDDDGVRRYYTAIAEITEYTSGTSVKARVDVAWPDTAVIASGSWRMTTTTISGLWHLEGETVKVLADGAVHPDATVANGEIELEQGASVVHVGLGYNCDLQTLPLAFETAAFGQTVKKNVNRVHMRVYGSSGVFAGPSFDKLTETKQRTTETYGEAPMPRTTRYNLMVKPSWDEDAPICVRQSDPLPLTLVALAPEFAHGG